MDLLPKLIQVKTYVNFSYSDLLFSAPLLESLAMVLSADWPLKSPGARVIPSLGTFEPQWNDSSVSGPSARGTFI